MDYFPLTLCVYYFLKSVYIFAHWRSYLNIHILIYSNGKSCYFCMPGCWLTTGQRGHILAFFARRPRSLHHTWPHRWSCSCMAHQRGCSWCCLRRCGFGLNLDTPGLRWAGINVWSTSLDKLTDKTTTEIPLHNGTGLFQWPLAWQSSRGTPCKRKPSLQWKLQEELKRFGPWGWKHCWKPCPGSSRGLHAIAEEK